MPVKRMRLCVAELPTHPYAYTQPQKKKDPQPSNALEVGQREFLGCSVQQAKCGVGAAGGERQTARRKARPENA